MHYRLADPVIVPGLTASVVQIAGEHGLIVKHAKKTLELRPPVQVDKGTAALEVASAIGATEQRGVDLRAPATTSPTKTCSARCACRFPAAVTVWVAHDSPASATAAEFSVAGHGRAARPAQRDRSPARRRIVRENRLALSALLRGLGWFRAL